MIYLSFNSTLTISNNCKKIIILIHVANQRTQSNVTCSGAKKCSVKINSWHWLPKLMYLYKVYYLAQRTSFYISNNFALLRLYFLKMKLTKKS